MIIKKKITDEELKTYYQLAYLEERLSFNVNFIERNQLTQFYSYVENIAENLSSIMLMKQEFLLTLLDKYDIQYNQNLFIDYIERTIIGDKKE